MISFSEYITEGSVKDLLIKYADAIELMGKLKYDDETVMDVLAKLAKIKNPQKVAVVRILKAADVKDTDLDKIRTKFLGA